MGNDNDNLYKKLMYYRPQSVLHTRSKIDRSHTISYRVGYVMVICTKYADGRAVVDVDVRGPNPFGVTFTWFKEQITGGRARAIYDRAKKYCK